MRYVKGYVCHTYNIPLPVQSSPVQSAQPAQSAQSAQSLHVPSIITIAALVPWCLYALLTKYLDA